MLHDMQLNVCGEICYVMLIDIYSVISKDSCVKHVRCSVCILACHTINIYFVCVM